MDDPSPLDELFNKYKIPILLSLVGGVLLVGGVISSGILQKTFVKSTQGVQPTTTNSFRQVKVDISGAVVSPGVYDLNSEARVEDLIKAAGGVTEDANPEYLSKSINLAQKISDGMKIYIPFVGETGQVSGASTTGSVSGSGITSLNQASGSELENLPGVGPVTAQKIIDNRPYSSIEEVLSKKAVSRSVYLKIKDKISI